MTLTKVSLASRIIAGGESVMARDKYAYDKQYLKEHVIWKRIAFNNTKKDDLDMLEWINQQDNAKELMIAFNKQKALSKIQNDPYRFVLAWFLKTFQNYDEDYKAFFAELSRKEAKKNDVLFSSDIVSEDMAEDFE